MTRGIRRPCIECNDIALEGRARCALHEKRRGDQHNHRRNTLAPWNGAAAQIRRALGKAGWGYCNEDGALHPATDLEVDHILELADGGTDTPDNIQLLCRPHHQAKTTAATRARHPSSG